MRALSDSCYLTRGQAPSSSLPRPYLDKPRLLCCSTAVLCRGYSCYYAGVAIYSDSYTGGANEGSAGFLQHLEPFLRPHDVALRAGEAIVSCVVGLHLVDVVCLHEIKEGIHCLFESSLVCHGLAMGNSR